jgi:phosphoenolpyruvate-protein phosphotransferase (PTS system enzyme I)
MSAALKAAEQASRRIEGRAASPGFAFGTVHVLAARDARATRHEGADAEAAKLKLALGQALAAISTMMEASEGEAVEMLAFQQAMLDDDALAELAFEAINAGKSAIDAWSEAMASEIAGYEASEDEYFQARSADLIDIRDRVTDHLTGAAADAVPNGSIIFADDLGPSRFLATDWTGGAILLAKGSPTSHVAMLARSRGVPMIVGLAEAVPAGEVVAVDAAAACVIVNPDAIDQRAFETRAQTARQQTADAERFLKKPAFTADGERVKVMLNIADPADLEGLDPVICDGIGLVRTELLFEGKALPDEETQTRAYRTIVEWAAGRTVTIRTLDAGGDKPIPGVTTDGESNPFLGQRGVRLTLAKPDLFKTQLAALLRAASHGDLEIMVPMIAVPRELEATRALLDEVAADLSRRGIPHRRPALGMMVEVPSAAVAPDLFNADFFSIGSNDLTQYVLAAGRDIASVADLARTDDPAVLRMIGQVVAHGRATGIKVSLCGDAGGDPAILPALLATGLRSVSMAPGLVARAKQVISTWSAAT